MSHQIKLGQRTLRLALCTTVAGAAFALPTAHAAIVTVDFSSNPLSTVPFNIDGVYLNLVTGTAATSGSDAPGYDINPYYSGAAGVTPAFRILMPSASAGGIVGAAGAATALSAGTVIGLGSSFLNGLVNGTRTSVPTTSVFGINFLNEATGATNYGYLTISQSANPVVAGSVRILGYSFENSGASITVASPVPETSTALMMVAGLLGAGALMRRRSTAG